MCVFLYLTTTTKTNQNTGKHVSVIIFLKKETGLERKEMWL